MNKTCLTSILIWILFFNCLFPQATSFSLCVCVCVRKSVCSCMCVCACMCACVWVCACGCVSTCVHLCVCVCVYMRMCLFFRLPETALCLHHLTWICDWSQGKCSLYRGRIWSTDYREGWHMGGKFSLSCLCHERRKHFSRGKESWKRIQQPVFMVIGRWVHWFSKNLCRVTIGLP